MKNHKQNSLYKQCYWSYTPYDLHVLRSFPKLKHCGPISSCKRLHNIKLYVLHNSLQTKSDSRAIHNCLIQIESQCINSKEYFLSKGYTTVPYLWSIIIQKFGVVACVSSGVSVKLDVIGLISITSCNW